MKTKVARDTENVFDNEFWFGLSGIANALDNFEARRYVNSRCLFFKYVHLPLLVQVVVTEA